MPDHAFPNGLEAAAAEPGVAAAEPGMTLPIAWCAAWQALGQLQLSFAQNQLQLSPNSGSETPAALIKIACD